MKSATFLLISYKATLILIILIQKSEFAPTQYFNNSIEDDVGFAALGNYAFDVYFNNSRKPDFKWSFDPDKAFEFNINFEPFNDAPILNIDEEEPLDRHVINFDFELDELPLLVQQRVPKNISLPHFTSEQTDNYSSTENPSTYASQPSNEPYDNFEL